MEPTDGTGDGSDMSRLTQLRVDWRRAAIIGSQNDAGLDYRFCDALYCVIVGGERFGHIRAMST